MSKKDRSCYVADIPKNLHGDFQFEVHSLALASENSTFEIENLRTREFFEAIPCVDYPVFSGEISFKVKSRNRTYEAECKLGETGAGKWTLIDENIGEYFHPLKFGMSMKYRDSGVSLQKKLGAGKFEWTPHIWQPENCSYRRRLFHKKEIKLCLESLQLPVLFVGDSLIQFYPNEISYLLGMNAKLNSRWILHKHRGPVKNLLPQLSKILGKRKSYSKIVLNSGAWDLRSTTAAEYRSSLQELVRMLSELTNKHTQIIFRTTSAPKLPENKRVCEKFPQRLDRIVLLNEIATSIFHRAGYKVFDVFPSSLAAPPNWYDDNLHLGSHNDKSGVHAMHVQMLLSMLC